MNFFLGLSPVFIIRTLCRLMLSCHVAFEKSVMKLGKPWSDSVIFKVYSQHPLDMVSRDFSHVKTIPQKYTFIRDRQLHSKTSVRN